MYSSRQQGLDNVDKRRSNHSTRSSISGTARIFLKTVENVCDEAKLENDKKSNPSVHLTQKEHSPQSLQNSKTSEKQSDCVKVASRPKASSSTEERTLKKSKPKKPDKSTSTRRKSLEKELPPDKFNSHEKSRRRSHDHKSIPLSEVTSTLKRMSLTPPDNKTTSKSPSPLNSTTPVSKDRRKKQRTHRLSDEWPPAEHSWPSQKRRKGAAWSEEAENLNNKGIARKSQDSHHHEDVKESMTSESDLPDDNSSILSDISVTSAGLSQICNAYQEQEEWTDQNHPISDNGSPQPVSSNIVNHSIKSSATYPSSNHVNSSYGDEENASPTSRVVNSKLSRYFSTHSGKESQSSRDGLNNPSDAGAERTRRKKDVEIYKPPCIRELKKILKEKSNNVIQRYSKTNSKKDAKSPDNAINTNQGVKHADTVISPQSVVSSNAKSATSTTTTLANKPAAVVHPLMAGHTQTRNHGSVVTNRPLVFQENIEDGEMQSSELNRRSLESTWDEMPSYSVSESLSRSPDTQIPGGLQLLRRHSQEFETLTFPDSYVDTAHPQRPQESTSPAEAFASFPGVRVRYRPPLDEDRVNYPHHPMPNMPGATVMNRNRSLVGTRCPAPQSGYGGHTRGGLNNVNNEDNMPCHITVNQNVSSPVAIEPRSPSINVTVEINLNLDRVQSPSPQSAQQGVTVIPTVRQTVCKSPNVQPSPYLGVNKEQSGQTHPDNDDSRTIHGTNTRRKLVNQFSGSQEDNSEAGYVGNNDQNESRLFTDYRHVPQDLYVRRNSNGSTDTLAYTNTNYTPPPSGYGRGSQANIRNDYGMQSKTIQRAHMDIPLPTGPLNQTQNEGQNHIRQETTISPRNDVGGQDQVSRHDPGQPSSYSNYNQKTTWARNFHNREQQELKMNKLRDLLQRGIARTSQSLSTSSVSKSASYVPPSSANQCHYSSEVKNTLSKLHREPGSYVYSNNVQEYELSPMNNSWEYSPIDKKKSCSDASPVTKPGNSWWDGGSYATSSPSPVNNKTNKDTYASLVTAPVNNKTDKDSYASLVTTPVKSKWDEDEDEDSKSQTASVSSRPLHGRGRSTRIRDWFDDQGSEDSASLSDSSYKSESVYKPPPPPVSPSPALSPDAPSQNLPFWAVRQHLQNKYKTSSVSSSSTSTRTPESATRQDNGQLAYYSCPAKLNSQEEVSYPPGYLVQSQEGSSYQAPSQYQAPHSLQSYHSRLQRLQSGVRSSSGTPLSSRSALSAASGIHPLAKVDWVSWKQKFQQRFANCAVPYVDSHCHIDFLFDRSGFQGSYAKFMATNEETYPSNYAGCLAVFCEPRSFTPHGGLWRDLLSEPTVWGAMGCHPKCITDFTDEAFQNLRECMKNPKIMALGEIGLDYSRDFHKHSVVQKRGFIRQIELALELNKPLVIHCRDAEDDCFEIMQQLLPKDYTIHRHCFTADWAEAQRWLDYFPNLFIGLTPLVTYRSAKEVHEVARNIPLERLLLETDSPYFVPQKVPRDEMKLSHPGMAITVADEVARLKNTDIDNVLYHCRRNTRRMYKI